MMIPKNSLTLETMNKEKGFVIVGGACVDGQVG
jgi:hypothetical protein